jgi:carbamoyl-phosphate synthase small subunit
MGKLILKDQTTLEGISFGYHTSIAGEVVFATGMTGYPQSFTDPSFAGQILVLTYPLIGNYGVPKSILWESKKMQIAGLIVSDYIDTPSHYENTMTLAAWMKKEKVPGLIIKDTRFLTQYLRDNGSTLGKMIIDKDIPFYDPNVVNLVQMVSQKEITTEGKGNKTIVLIDCGAKRNIARNFVKRGVKVITVPWDYDVFGNKSTLKFHALFISNGPGDPKTVDRTIETVRKSMEHNMPTLGICLGNQILALAGGGDTYKLKFGHRSQNQPCALVGSPRCYITTQNHGFAVVRIPEGFKPWFVNVNDNSNEGIIHETLPFMSVQFHPESTPGPLDAEWIFDYFIEKV